MPVTHFINSSLPSNAPQILLVAVVFEFLIGEPSTKIHPVVWMGKVTSGFMRFAPTTGAVRQCVFGAFVALAVPSLFGAAGHLIAHNPVMGQHWLHTIVCGAVLSTTFSLRALEKAALDMCGAISKPVLTQDDRQLLRSLCSRDPSALSKEQLAAATVESVAENSSDSFVAPLLYFALFGLPGALIYRTVNTLDAMIGYHGRYEYLGKPAARFDDILNWIPARVCTVFLLLAGALAGGSVANGWRIARRDHGETESPNAGWPMATMAGLLGVQLTKTDHYSLGDDDSLITAKHISQSCRIARICFFLTVGLSLLLICAQLAWIVSV